MPTPEFVLALRARIGGDLLFMSGVTGVVLDGEGRVLLGRRADVGRWSLPSGILEPGEQPATALVREIEEETAVHVRIDGLSSVLTGEPARYPNGDWAQFLDLCFRCAYVSGDPRPNDGEMTEVGWFDPAALPPDVTPTSRRKLQLALSFSGTTWFEGPEDHPRHRPPDPSEVS